MSLAASFSLIGELLPLSSSRDDNEVDQQDLIKLVYDRINDFIDNETNDECACAILNLLSQSRSCLYNSTNSKRAFFLLLLLLL